MNYRTIFFIGILILIFIGLVFSINSYSRDHFKSSYVANVWQTEAGTEILFPEKCIPRFQKNNLKGFGYSGGGSRSYVALIGYLRALNRMGLSDKVDYIGTVSGGSWFNAVYSYAQSKGVSRDLLLGKSLNIETMTFKNLDRENFNNRGPNFFMGARVNKSPILANVAYAFLPGNGIPYSEAWNYAMGKIFLEPYRLNENVPFTLNETMAKQINSDNKTNLDILKLKDTDPFWICDGTLECNPNEGVSCPFLITEFTPMYSGFVKSYKLSDHSKIGGYVLETYAFGCDSPNTVLSYIDYSDIVDKYGKFCKSSPFKVNVNNFEKTCFTLRQAIGTSSSAYAATVFKIASKIPILDLTKIIPSYRIWFTNPTLPTTSDSQCSFNILKNKCVASQGFDDDSCQNYLGGCYSNTAKQCSGDNDCSKGVFKCNNNKNGSSLHCRISGLSGCKCQKTNRKIPLLKDMKSRVVQIGDGQASENIGILSLVRRGVKKIIAFCNSDTRLFDDFGNVFKDLTGKEACYTNISNLFGVVNDCDPYNLSGTSVKIFDNKDYDIVYGDLRNAFLSGGPTFSRRTLKTISNDLYGIKEGFEVDILFLVLQPCTRFIESLQSELKTLIENDPLAILFSNFPNYETVIPNPLEGIIELTRVQINALSTYADWYISQTDVASHVIEMLTYEEEPVPTKAPIQPVVAVQDYKKNNFLQPSGPNSDLPGQPIKNNLNNCKIECDKQSDCIGFSRSKFASDDDSNADCYLKKTASSLVYNSPQWQTYVKSSKKDAWGGKPIKFVFKTSNDYYSGTDSQVIIGIYDNNNNLNSFKLDNPGNDFQRGGVDTYTINNQKIGLYSITDKPIKLSLDGNDNWKVDSIAIYYDNKLIKTYNPNLWMGTAKGSVKSIDLANNYGIKMFI
jgi:hypothetical protein